MRRPSTKREAPFAPWVSMNSASPSVLYVNGRFYAEEEPSLSALDRGFTLGDGVFETMRASHGRILHLSQHLSRLRHGASVLEILAPSENELTAALQGVLSRISDAQVVLRLTVSRGIDKGRGIALPPSPLPTVVIRATPLVPHPTETYKRGFHAAISSIRRNESSPLSRIKSCNYGDSILARAEATRRGYDEAVMLNSMDEVACASIANLFIVREGKLLTPPEESGVLPGITRACILEVAPTLQIPAQEAPFNTDVLLHASEAFLTNTIMGVMPLTEIEGQAIGSGRPGPLTMRLAAAYENSIGESEG